MKNNNFHPGFLADMLNDLKIQTKPEEESAIPAAADPRPGDILLSTYRVESDAIKGGMGAVWRVHHTGWNVDLAMKKPKADFFRTEKQKKDFTNECRNWMNLGLHPNIVSCYYVREIDGIPAIFSEWMTNGSLESHINDKSLYKGTNADVQERLLDIAIQFARGLRYAHENNLIHQDVKPDNLLLTEEWAAKISDFGLARARTMLTFLDGTATQLEADSNATMVTPGGGKTPAYCSPEQAASQLLTKRTDIYSWAVSVLEMYLGFKPWAHGRALTGPLAGVACRDYMDMCTERPVPKALRELLAHCLEQNPENRPKDFSYVEQELQRIYRDVTRREYPDDVFLASATSADSLNNRALSYLELGEEAEAEKCWEEALVEDPLNSKTRFNYILYLLKHNKITQEDAETLFSDVIQNNIITNMDEVLELYGKLYWQIGGEDEIKHRMYLFYERGFRTYERTLGQMLQEGRICSGYTLSRIQNVKLYEQMEEKFDKTFRQIKASADSGDYRNAASIFMRIWDTPEYSACLKRGKWIELHERVRRKCYLLEDLRSWTYKIINDVPSDDLLSFSSDSTRLLCGEKIFDVRTGALISDNGSDRKSICSNISPDGTFYLRVGRDGFEQFFVRTGQIKRFSQKGTIRKLTISPDGCHAAVVSEDSLIYYWDLKAGSAKGFRITDGRVRNVIPCYDNKRLLIQTDQLVGVFDIPTAGIPLHTAIDYSMCDGIAVNTQFTKVLMNIRRPAGSVLGKVGVGILDLEKRTFALHEEIMDKNDFPLFWNENPRQVTFANNDIDILIEVKSNVHVYSAESRKVLDWFGFLQPVSGCALSRDGTCLAVLSGGKLYLHRIMQGFVYADMKNVPDPDSISDRISVRAAARNTSHSDEERSELERMGRQWLAPYCIEQKKNAHARERLEPYARTLVSANPGRSREELLPAFIEELEDRGMGYVSSEYAWEILKG